MGVPGQQTGEYGRPGNANQVQSERVNKEMSTRTEDHSVVLLLALHHTNHLLFGKYNLIDKGYIWFLQKVE